MNRTPFSLSQCQLYSHIQTMRSRTVHLAIALTASLFSSAQQNPFAPIGRDVPFLTLTKGQYPEVFTNDTLRTVCGMVYNRVTGQVVGFVETDTVFTESGMKPELVSRWLSMDPLANKFPNESPYIFAGNNPILLIDKYGAYKYPAELDAAYRKRYPLLTKYLASMVRTDVMKSTVILAALH